MDEKQKMRLKELKELCRVRVKERRQAENVLLKECLEALGNGCILEAESEAVKILNDFFRNNKIPGKEIGREDLEFMREKNYYIIWDEASLPVVICCGERIVENLDDILCVSFDTFFMEVDKNVVIEYSHDNRIIKYS